jgi:transposase InsO family protein
VARHHGEGHRDGHHGTEDGVVAARSCRPPRRCRLIHHSDAGSQYTSIAFAETLVLKGIAASIGSVGDAYDKGLAETTIGLFKTEAVGRGSPFLTGPLRIIDAVEYATMEWVDWFNNGRLHSVLNYVPPEEYEATYYSQTQGSQPATPQP